jgi:uncharacterized membrane protein
MSSRSSSRTRLGADYASRTTPGSALRPTTAAVVDATVHLVMTVQIPMPPPVRRAVLTAHIIASVGLLGDSAGVLAINVRAATTSDPALAASSYELLEMFSVVFGIPLSFASLGTGLALGLGTKWGVLRHRWVTAKLLVILSVIVVGAVIIGPATATMREGGGGAETRLIVASAYDVLALSLATGLSVYKPRRRRQGRGTARRIASGFVNSSSTFPVPTRKP